MDGKSDEMKYENKIICGDCLEVMKDWHDKCVDLMCIDPPWPDLKIWPDVDARKIFDERCDLFCRVSKRLIVILGQKCNPNFLHRISLKFFRYCWLKYARPNYVGNLLLGAEIAFVYGEMPSRRPDRSIFGGECVKTNHERISKIDHPCARSLQHMEWLVKHYSNEPELVVDAFCGSGTTCVAAKKLGRHYIGIDISPEYCKIAEERLRAVDTGVPVKEARKGQKALFE